MKYYILRHEDAGGEFIDGEVSLHPSIEGYYQIGKSVVSAGTVVKVKKPIKKLNSDFFFTTSGAFFVSGKMREVLEKHHTLIEFYEADIQYFGGVSVEGEYYFIHVSCKVSCFDYFNSEYSGKVMVLDRISKKELSPDYKVRGVKKMAVVESETSGLDFFFVDNVIWIDPIITESVVISAAAEKLNLNIEQI
ncbi:imm11 family protein [Pseudomonas alkylphenolica]|uniref:imm11 family protein n=1 Tax=Pseudomonas alkylphenolica TaxID=237609 RepID=UPI00315D3CB5